MAAHLGARHLAGKRGEMWVKEIDDIYLLPGALGIIGSVNRVEGIAHRFTKMDVVGPAVLITAIVLRWVKTRAEIGGWNKPGFQALAERQPHHVPG